MTSRSLRMAILSSGPCFLIGCASIVSRPDQTITVTSDPPGAMVQVRDETTTTPGSVTLQRKNEYTVRVSKEGYYDQMTRLRRQQSPWVLGNLLWDLPTTGLVMFLTQGQAGLIVVGPGTLVDCATGAGYVLAPDKVHVALEKRPPGDADVAVPSRLHPRVSGEVSVPGAIHGLTEGAGSLWVSYRPGIFSPSTLCRIDPQSGEVLDTLPNPAKNDRFFIGHDALWYVAYAFPAKGRLCKVDLKTKQIVGEVPLPSRFAAMAVDETAVWVVTTQEARSGLSATALGLEVLKIDPHTLQITARIVLDQKTWETQKAARTTSAQIAVGLESIWVGNSSCQAVARIDPQSLRVTAIIPVPQSVRALIMGEDAVWVFGHASRPSDAPAQVARIDPRSNYAARPVVHAGTPVAETVGLGAVWILNAQDGAVQWIDQASNRLSDTFLHVDEVPTASAWPHVLVAHGSVWMSTGKKLLRISPE